jgi:hypothetical protein
MKTAPEIREEIIKRIEAPRYELVRAPALALYARPSLQHVYPFYDQLDAESKARAQAIIEATHPYLEGAMAGFRAGASNRETLVLDGNYLFVLHQRGTSGAGHQGVPDKGAFEPEAVGRPGVGVCGRPT